MIYFDNSSTTLIKPKSVGEAVKNAIHTFGNASRGLHHFSRKAAHEIDKARENVAKLIGLKNPLNIAFTSSGTEALNLVIGGLINSTHSIVTTQLEHNSVLRPLYLTGAEILFLDCDNDGNVLVSSFDKTIKDNTKFLVCTHGSNVTGNIVDVKALYQKCKENGIIMILDICQTFGNAKVDLDMADIFCFTGHKGLFSPQGVGGVITKKDYDFKIIKTGGAGYNSYDLRQSNKMPDIFEVGTINAHSIAGLNEGLKFIFDIGLNEIIKKETLLLKAFYDEIKNLSGIQVYGDFDKNKERLPIVSLNITNMTAIELGYKLVNDYDIAVRASTHCAPLMHKFFKTDNQNLQGAVRFSFSYFNTIKEIELAISALKKIRGI